MHIKLAAFAGIAAVILAAMPSFGNETAPKVPAEKVSVTFIGSVDKTFRNVQPNPEAAFEKPAVKSNRLYKASNIRVIGTPFLPDN